jgi:hypothetical protein
MRVLRLGVKLSLAAAASMLALAGSPAGAQPPPEAPAPPGDAIGQLLQSTPQEPRLPVAKAAPPAATADADNDDDAVSDKPVAKAPPPPAKRIRRNAAIIQALDKVTAETLRFEADVNQPVRYKDLPTSRSTPSPSRRPARPRRRRGNCSWAGCCPTRPPPTPSSTRSTTPG